MGRMTSHEILINIIGSTVLNIITYPSTPIAPSGILKNDFSYTIRLPEFGETIKDLLKKRGAKVPDILLVNEKEGLLIIVECKSDYTFEMEKRLTKQVEFYSSEDFKKIWKEIFPDLFNIEIWILIYKEIGKKIVELIKSQNKNEFTNIVVWDVELRKEREEVYIKKVYGSHLDNKLNKKMESEGLVCSPPRIELLVDPTLAYGERVYRIGRRILTYLASKYLTEKDRIVTIQDFKERYPDITVMTDRELKRCLRYLLKLIPEIGGYNSATGELLLSKRPSLDKIKNKLENIQKLTEEDLKIKLAKISKTDIYGRKIKLKKKQQATKLDKWLPTDSSKKNRAPNDLPPTN